MNDNSHFGLSRARVGASTKEVDVEQNSRSKNSFTHHSLTKKNSWTSLATKARRFSKKRRKTSLMSSSKGKGECGKSLPQTGQKNAKSLEDYRVWGNHYLLRALHREISPDLRTAVGDGITLINLVESLTNKCIPGVSHQPVTWSQKLENVHLCFQFLKAEGVRLNGISVEDVIEGQLNDILNLFQQLETHFEYLRYPKETYMDKNHLMGNGKNGRISSGYHTSGYHTEDDGANGGRTTPIIDALPGLLAGSDTNSETDDDIVEPSDIRVHYNDKTGKMYHQLSSDVFTGRSRYPRNSVTFPHGLDKYHTWRDVGTLDNIGYMPSHPSAKARMSGNKTKFGKNDSTHPTETGGLHEKAVVTTSHVKMATPRHAVLLNAEDHHENFCGQENYGLEFTASDFGLDDSVSVERGSISSTGTPVLPDLSSTSSFEDPPLDFSSDASEFARNGVAAFSRLPQDPFTKREQEDAVDIQKQVESLHSMYQKLLVLVDKNSQEVNRKTKWNLPKISGLQVKTRSPSKQRTKDMKSVSRRFNRIESHIVTLARSVDHLRSEVRSQADTSRRLEELKVDVNEFKDSIHSNSFHTRHLQRSNDYKQRLRRLQKLKSFFGEEPPMVTLLLQRMGYDRFIPHFKAEEIGILELPYMTEQRLQNLGIPLGPRLRMLEEMQKFW